MSLTLRTREPEIGHPGFNQRTNLRIQLQIGAHCLTAVIGCDSTLLTGGMSPGVTDFNFRHKISLAW